MSYYRTSNNYEELLHQIKCGHEIIGQVGEHQLWARFNFKPGWISCRLLSGPLYFIIAPNDIAHTGANELDYFTRICEENKVNFITNGK